MKIAIVGAGLFGVTVALKIDEQFKDYDISVFESSNDIFSAASRSNQLRLHRGYHYPRSPETAASLLSSIDYFVQEYKESVIDRFDHYYCLSKQDSLVDSAQYLSFCDRFNLEYEIIDNFSSVDSEKIALTIKAKENLLDYKSIYQTCHDRLKKSNIKLLLNTRFDKSLKEDYDLVINCTYANINEALKPSQQQRYQFEICEKIVVKMPNEMVEKSIVVMDGPFMCVDPYGNTGFSLLGNVDHAIHYSNVGISPDIPKEILGDLNQGIVKRPNKTNFDKFIEHGKLYIPSLADCSYQGSMFTVRAVFPNTDDTDARPTVISNIDEKVVNVFSGKIDTCVVVANKIIDRLHNS
jgi:hypothetical protein